MIEYDKLVVLRDYSEPCTKSFFRSFCVHLLQFFLKPLSIVNFWFFTLKICELSFHRPYCTFIFIVNSDWFDIGDLGRFWYLLACFSQISDWKTEKSLGACYRYLGTFWWGGKWTDSNKSLTPNLWFQSVSRRHCIITLSLKTCVQDRILNLSIPRYECLYI